MRPEIQQEPSHLHALRHNAAWIVLTLPFLAIPYLRPSEMLPDLCMFRRLTGISCMFCGFTRAFEDLAHGHFREALLDCPAAAPLYLGLWAGFAAALVLTLKGRSLKLNCTEKERNILLGGAAVLLLANWVWRLV